MYCDWKRLAHEMKQNGLDILVATTTENIYYLTNYYSVNKSLIRGVQIYAVVTRESAGASAIVAPMADMDTIANVSSLAAVSIVPYGTFYIEGDPPDLAGYESRLHALARAGGAQPGPREALVAALKGLSRTATIGVDERGIEPSILEALPSLLPGRSVRPAFGLLHRVRMVKTPPEVDRLARAARITERAAAVATKAAVAGMTEREMAAIFEGHLVREGARPFFTVILFGRRGVEPNGMPSDAHLAPGDVIRFDIGCMLEGYAADISRTAVFGEPSAKVRDYYHAIQRGEEEAIAAMRRWVPASEIHRVAVEATRRAGIPHYRRHHVGHGVGLDVYDPPLLGPQDHTPLEAGMVFEVETPYYEFGFGGLQVEDTVLVTPNGAEILTTSSRDLWTAGH